MTRIFYPTSMVFAALTLSPVALAASEPMDHNTMPGMSHPPKVLAASQSRTPIPELTNADRAAVYDAPGGHMIHDSGINSLFLINQLEWQGSDDGSALSWDAKGWVGGDIDRLWLRTEGERAGSRTEKAEIQALWGHAISPWWDLVGGLRQDFKPGDSESWAALGVQGMALYNFEAQATVFIGESGQTAARLEGDYDILLTNRLVLQPTAEVNFYGKNDPQRQIGSGLSESEIGIRLRYEIRREFAPYIGVTWNRAYGKTAEYASAEGDDRSNLRWVLGVRLWF